MQNWAKNFVEALIMPIFFNCPNYECISNEEATERVANSFAQKKLFSWQRIHNLARPRSTIGYLKSLTWNLAITSRSYEHSVTKAAPNLETPNLVNGICKMEVATLSTAKKLKYHSAPDLTNLYQKEFGQTLQNYDRKSPIIEPVLIAVAKHLKKTPNPKMQLIQLH